MNTVTIIGLLTLLVLTIVAIIILVLYKHTLRARGSIHEAKKTGSGYNLSVTVKNSGKQPIYLQFVSIKTKYGRNHGQNMTFNFIKTSPGQVLVPVGGSATTNIEGENGMGYWKNISDSKNTKIYVHDSLGNKHRVII